MSKKFDEAISWLQFYLKDGPVSASKIQADITCPVSSRTLEKVRSFLGIESIRRADGWYWALGESDFKGSVLDETIKWLKAYLARGPVSAQEIQYNASRPGGEKTLKTAKLKLNIASIKLPGGGWMWVLPEQQADFVASLNAVQGKPPIKPNTEEPANKDDWETMDEYHERKRNESKSKQTKPTPRIDPLTGRRWINDGSECKSWEDFMQLYSQECRDTGQKLPVCDTKTMCQLVDDIILEEGTDNYHKILSVVANNCKMYPHEPPYPLAYIEMVCEKRIAGFPIPEEERLKYE